MLREDNKRLMESKASSHQRATSDRPTSSGSSWVSSGTPGTSHMGTLNVGGLPVSTAANIPQPVDEDIDCYREHVRKVKDAKDREIILLETELRKVRLEKDKQILELKEEIKKLETMKRSEIAASKRDMQVLLEQQEKNWKHKFFVNSSENILEAPPTHPSDYRSAGVAGSSKSRASPKGGSASDNIDGSPCYRTSYQANEAPSKNLPNSTTSKSFCSNSQRSSSSGNSSNAPPPSNTRTSIAAAPDPKSSSASSSHFHHRHSLSTNSPNSNAILTQKALEAKEREIRDLENELSRLREKVDPGANLNVSLKGSRSRDSSSSRIEPRSAEHAAHHHPSGKHCCSGDNTIPRKHKRDHSADKVMSRQGSRYTHHMSRPSHHHIKHAPPPTVARTHAGGGNESDSGISSTNHTPKDYQHLTVDPRLSAHYIPKPAKVSASSSSRVKSGPKISPSVLPNNLGEEIELREDHIKFLETEKQRLEDCLTSKDERIRLLESQIGHHPSQGANSAMSSQGIYYERSTSSQLTLRSGSYMPHPSGINGYMLAPEDPYQKLQPPSQQRNLPFDSYQVQYLLTYLLYYHKRKFEMY